MAAWTALSRFRSAWPARSSPTSYTAVSKLCQPFVQPSRRLAVGRRVDAIGKVSVKGFVRKSLEEPPPRVDERIFILPLDPFDAAAGVKDRRHLIGRHTAIERLGQVSFLALEVGQRFLGVAADVLQRVGQPAHIAGANDFILSRIEIGGIVQIAALLSDRAL